jgi:hypothetical protein
MREAKANRSEQGEQPKCFTPAVKRSAILEANEMNIRDEYLFTCKIEYRDSGRNELPR